MSECVRCDGELDSCGTCHECRRRREDELKDQLDAARLKNCVYREALHWIATNYSPGAGAGSMARAALDKVAEKARCENCGSTDGSVIGRPGLCTKCAEGPKCACLCHEEIKKHGYGSPCGIDECAPCDTDKT